MKFNSRYTILIIFIFFKVTTHSQDIPFVKNLINKMIENIDNQNYLEFVLERNERNEKGFKKGRFFAKVNISPYKIYIKNEIPRKGSEILYMEEENNDKALVNPNFFPYINVSLSPENNLMFAGGHHCLKDLGFNFINDCFKLYLNKYGNDFFNFIEYDGEYEWDNRPCHKLTINYPDYKKLEYVTKENESLYKISEDKLINIAKLKEYNPKFEIFEEIDKNEIITITNIYSKKTIVFIDAINFFPVYQMLYDEKGLYEKYSYSNLTLNKKFKAEEFKSEFEEYDF